MPPLPWLEAPVPGRGGTIRPAAQAHSDESCVRWWRCRRRSPASSTGPRCRTPSRRDPRGPEGRVDAQQLVVGGVAHCFFRGSRIGDAGRRPGTQNVRRSFSSCSASGLPYSRPWARAVTAPASRSRESVWPCVTCAPAVREQDRAGRDPTGCAPRTAPPGTPPGKGFRGRRTGCRADPPGEARVRALCGQGAGGRSPGKEPRFHVRPRTLCDGARTRARNRTTAERPGHGPRRRRAHGRMRRGHLLPDGATP